MRKTNNPNIASNVEDNGSPQALFNLGEFWTAQTFRRRAAGRGQKGSGAVLGLWLASLPQRGAVAGMFATRIDGGKPASPTARRASSKCMGDTTQAAHGPFLALEASGGTLRGRAGGRVISRSPAPAARTVRGFPHLSRRGIAWKPHQLHPTSQL